MAIQMQIITLAMQAKAERLAESIPSLPKGRSKHNGQGFYVIPSSTDPLTVAHYSSDLGCTCRGFDRRGFCTHQIACQIVLRRQSADRIAAAQKLRAEHGVCSSKGCIQTARRSGGRCDDHNRALCEKLGI